jgi:hypothetical protein
MALVDSDPARALLSLLREPTLKPHEVARTLDAMAHAERVSAIRATGRAEQRRLYEAVDGFRPLAMTDLVPAGVPALTPVRHHGRNTLPAFTWFEKRFCRPTGADPARPERLVGYNEQSTRWLTGPGYFVVRPGARPGELLVDYTERPVERPAAWPPIRPNERGLSRFVYGFMIDTLRGVSTHVSVGSAARRGRDIGSWFLLCRED